MTNDTLAGAEVPLPPQRRHRSLPDRLGFWLLIALVVLAPVPDGSVALLWIQVWTAVAALVVLLLSYRDVSRESALVILGLAVVLAGYGLVAWLQSVSPGPAPLPIWSESSKVLGTELPPQSGSVRNAPLVFLGRPLLAALVLIAGMLVGPDGRRAVVVLRATVWAACLYGFIGLAGMLLSVQELRPFDQSGALTTFFLNKNTTATYLGSAFLIVFAQLLPRAMGLLRDRRSLVEMFRADGGRARAILAVLGLFLLILLPLTLSRAGLMLTIFFALGAIALRLQFRQGRRVLKVTLGLLVLLSFIYALSGESWRERQAQLGFDSFGRLNAYELMLGAAKDHPWLGLGLGSFTQSFPQYRTAELGFAGIFDIGHSTPIELIFEGGFPLAALVLTYVAACGVILVRGTLRRPSDSFVLAGLLVGLLGITHTSFDFSLQIPGYLIIFLAVVGMGLSRSFLPREVRRTPTRRKQYQSPDDADRGSSRPRRSGVTDVRA